MIVKSIVAAAMSLASTQALASIITIEFDQAVMNPYVEDGYSFVLGFEFSVSNIGFGNPAPALLYNSFNPSDATITRVDGGDFTFDQFDIGSLGGIGDGVTFAGFLDSLMVASRGDQSANICCDTRAGFGGTVIDELVISIGSLGNTTGVLDNLVFTQVSSIPLPTPASLLLGGLGAIGALRLSRRSTLG